MKNLKEFEKTRIMNMVEDTVLCICPSCKHHVYPTYINYFLMGRSGLYWCPKCLKGNAGIFWREL